MTKTRFLNIIYISMKEQFIAKVTDNRTELGNNICNRYNADTGEYWWEDESGTRYPTKAKYLITLERDIKINDLLK